MKAGTVVIALALIAAPPARSAEDLPPQYRLDLPLYRLETFRKLDTDRDGWISRQEAAAHTEVAAGFDKADEDHDGRLSFAEFEAIPLNRSDQPGKFRTPERG